MPSPNKIVFVDRDGTINLEKGYVHRWEDLEWIPGSLEGLQQLTQAQVQIYIVTNQSGIGRGYYSEDDFLQLTQRMSTFFKEEKINIAEVLYCPHHPEATLPLYRRFCDCRKPGTALFEKILENNPLPRQNMALVGDKNSDVIAGRKLSIPTYLVETGYGNIEKLSTQADFVVADLKTAVAMLLKTWEKTL